MSTTTFDAVPTIDPPAPAPARKPSLMPQLLRDHQELNVRLRNQAMLPGVTIQLFGTSVLGFALHGLLMGIAAQLLRSRIDFFYLHGYPVLRLPIALVLSLIGALGVCLPVFYFCSQMAGLDAPMQLIAAQALRANATGSALLLGLLPFYVAVALGCIAGLPISPEAVLLVGFALPFLSGLFGVRSVYLGFLDLAQAMPDETRTQRRRTLLLGMVLCATFIYLLVAPVALYRLAEVLGHFL